MEDFCRMVELACPVSTWHGSVDWVANDVGLVITDVRLGKQHFDRSS